MSNYVLCKTLTGFILFYPVQISRLSLTFPWPYQVFYDLRYRNSSKDKNSGVHQKACCSRFSLPLSSRVTNLPNKTLNFHDFPGLGNEILKFHDFPDFPLPVRCWFVSKNLACGWALMANIIIFIPKGVKACVELSICLSNPLLFHVSIPIVVINN